ncbi:MAG TPA: triose-phosphate isomerase [Candidatus Paceibacterota bacterium]|nr:triose-phosphate isomerase [Candidatus Paceibacterota bacterium]
MRKFLAANWKENPKTEAHALKLFKEVASMRRENGVAVEICPPFIYLEGIAKIYKRLKSKRGLSVGAQDVFWEERGPYTSEIGPRMLESLGVHHVIVGHSERRGWMHETDAMINKKIRLALRDGVEVILCVGEPLAVRRKGTMAAERYIKNQLKKDLQNVPKDLLRGNAVIVAYEPIWAIGTGRSDTPSDAAEMALMIKKLLKAHGVPKPNVLYGGSVNGKNIADYVKLREIDGALVGGASLKAAEFRKMLKKVSNN